MYKPIALHIKLLVYFTVAASFEEMKCVCTSLLVAILLQRSSEVELSMKGIVNLGKDVVEALSHYMEGKRLSGRKSLGQGADEPDAIATIVNLAYLCRDLDLCKGQLAPVVTNYVTMLAEAIESLFENLVYDIQNNNEIDTPKQIIFEEELKELIRDIKEILRNADSDIKENEKSFTWINVIKKISAIFIDRAIAFASQRLSGREKEVCKVKKKLTQQIVVVTTQIELKYENILCFKHDICSEAFDCTKYLNTLLGRLKNVPDGRAREFLKYFYDELSDTKFYNKLSVETARELDTILYDMSTSDNILTYNILFVIQKSVEERQNAIESKRVDSSFKQDVKLVHAILSDIDFFYSKQKSEAFQDFLGDFFDWAKEGGRLGASLRHVMKDIQSKLSLAEDDLVAKLIHEVRVFLEITVDPS